MGREPTNLLPSRRSEKDADDCVRRRSPTNREIQNVRTADNPKSAAYGLGRAEVFLGTLGSCFDKVQHRQECLCYLFPKLMHTMPSRINPTPANLVPVSFS